MSFKLVLLLWLLNYSSAQDRSCDYYQDVTVGRTYDINSPNYPNSYSPGVQCRWIARCPTGYNCRLDCPEIRLPQTTNCLGDRLLVSRSGDPALNAAERYCGLGSLSVVSTGQSISIGLIATTTSPGGRFQCTLTAQVATPPPPPTCRCGERRQSRIVGGQETGVNEFTMMAALVDLDIRQIKCGAVIITNRHVMTAAHCVYNKSAANFAVLVGEHNINTANPSRAVYAITSFTTHPQFSSINYDNDIAIVLVASPIQFNDFVLPVCLPFSQSANSFAGSKVTAVGWGTLFIGGPTSNVPMKVDLDVLQQSTCISRGAPVTVRQMCTYTSGKDSCQDDSGGPLMWTNPNNGLLYSVGIISAGRYCASTTPSINTRVTSYLDWIVANTRINQSQNYNFCVK